MYGDSLFGDELSTYYIVAGHSFGQMMHLLNNHSVELNPPLFFILTWVSQSLFGLSTESLRLVSLLAGTATIPLTFALGRMVGQRTGLVAAALAATSPFLIYYSTEARAYALMAFLVLAAALALLRALRSCEWGWWILYSVCTCAAAYTHYISVFALIALALWALVTQPAARLRTAVALVGAAILYLPELPVLRATSKSSGTGIMGFLDPLSVHSVRLDLSHWAIGHPYVSLTQVPGTVALVLIGAAVVGALAATAQRLGPRLRQAEFPRPSATEALVALLAVAAPVGAILYTLFRPSVWGARNVISLLARVRRLPGCAGQLPPCAVAPSHHAAAPDRLHRRWDDDALRIRPPARLPGRGGLPKPRRSSRGTGGRPTGTDAGAAGGG